VTGQGQGRGRTYAMAVDEVVTALARALPLAVGIAQDTNGRDHGAGGGELGLSSVGGTDVVVAVVVVTGAASEVRGVVFGCMREAGRAVDAVAVDREAEIASLESG